MRRALWLVAVALLAGCGSEPPAEEAARLVPKDALAYVHLSTDPDRDADRELLDRLGRLPSLRSFAAGVRERIGAIDFERDVRPWLGREAALALLDSGGPAADALVLLAVEDEPRAQGLVARATGADRGTRHRGIVVRRVGGVSAAFVGGFLAIGQDRVVRRAIDLHRGRGGALPGVAAFAGLRRPDERVLDAWAPAAGIRRVLGAQPGLLGALGQALDAPALRGVSLSAAPDGDGIRVWVRRQQRTAPAAAPFEPSLTSTAPADAFAYLALADLRPLAPLLDRLERLLDRDPAFDLRRDLLGALRGEAAVWAAPGLPVPLVTLVARTRDDTAAREAAGRLLGGLAAALTRAERPEGGIVPTLQQRRVAGVEASVLTLGPGAEVLAAVTRGRLVVSTGAAGIARASRDDGGLADAARFDRVMPDLPERAEALAFADLAQLLTLGEQAGLAAGVPLAAVREDLRRIRAAGAVAEREGSDTTAEFFFEIP